MIMQMVAQSIACWCMRSHKKSQVSETHGLETGLWWCLLEIFLSSWLRFDFLQR